MSVAVLSMSDGELRRLEVLRDVDRGGLPVGAAAQLLERGERQVWRLLKAFRAEGAPGLISKKRGRPSNRKTSEAIRSAVLWIVRQNYADFGPTLAAEKLAGEHGFAFSSETLRKWMIAEGLWLDRKQRLPACSPAAPSARVRWRAGAGRRLRTLVVRRPRAAMHAAGVCRRCDEPADAPAVCRKRVDLRLFPRRPGLSRGLGQAGGVLQRQARRLPGQPSGGARR